MSPRISDVDINTAEYWNNIYGNGNFPTLDFYNVQRYKVAAGLQSGLSALDIGCGQGGIGQALAAYGFIVDYMGVDHSQTAINTTVYPQGRYLCTDWREVVHQADTVYLLEILEHTEEPEKLLAHAAGLAVFRLVIGIPRHGVIGPALHRGEHMWDFTPGELVDMVALYGRPSAIMGAGSQNCVIAVDIHPRPKGRGR